MEPSARNCRNRRQIEPLRQPRSQAETVATRCYQLPIEAHGKERVDSSSPSEGLTKGEHLAFFVSSSAYAHRSIHPRTHAFHPDSPDDSHPNLAPG